MAACSLGLDFVSIEVLKTILSIVYPFLVLLTSACQDRGGTGRICLMKGCGKRFVPRPQDRLRAKYCSPDCRRLARKWRTWLSRKTAAGLAAKRRQNQRYRQKHRSYPSEYRKRNGERIRAIERASKRRCRLRNSDDSDVHKGGSCCRVPCHRPGCYVLFLSLVSLVKVRLYCGPSCRAPMRRFSSLLAQLRYRRTDSGNYRRKLCRYPARPPPI